MPGRSGRKDVDLVWGESVVARHEDGAGRMTEAVPVSAVDEARLADGMERLAVALPDRSDLLEAFAAFVRAADDDDLVRINAVQFGQEHGLETGAVVELFLHARKLGLAAMEWQYVCPGCGEVVERLTSLTSATAQNFCQVCSVDRDADLSDFIEVTFSIAPQIRRSRFHDPASLTPDEYWAALEIRARITRFNEEEGSHLIALKIGLHAGACLVVTLNDRLDYFGQTVNIAARVQGLAGADEILVTDDVLALPGARDLVGDLPTEANSVELKGVAGTIEVHRILP